MSVTPYGELSEADLTVDGVYEGGATGNIADDVLSRLLPGSGNQGGFRAAGRGVDKRFVVLYSSGQDQDWPDYLDINTGRFEYYGDNRSPGRELHETSRRGNRILRRVFDLLHRSPPQRDKIPPFFVFERYPTAASGHSIRFRGLAVPGAAGVPATDDLLAIWKTTKNERFQNYRAVFSILNVPKVARSWLADLKEGVRDSDHAPGAWRAWIERGEYHVLESESTTVVRQPDEQLPEAEDKVAILETVWRYFENAPRAFERFAAWLFAVQDRRVVIDEVTRYSRDGGRDAIGRYRLGVSDDPVFVEFSLEAKCYRPGIRGQRGNPVGVSDTSRLISRIRHRQFGVLVTTSVIGKQAYEEIREDRHPIIIVCGKDIADILTEKGLKTPDIVASMLAREFPL